jgi:quinol monooxygenase YgiN
VMTVAYTSRADDRVVQVARLYAAPGKEDQVLERIRNVVEFVKKNEPTTITYRAHRSIKEPNVILVYEVYPSKESRDRRANSTIASFREKFGQATADLYTRPIEIETFEILEE